ncbi:hypothetical protein DCCM_0171 [Desulfocucumis palustris]|uniref:Uncharacterized protein n=1 Tax=Desulfocucumis palustris TaxID=1898651 RepID=A0A2L2X7K3_9FIRM|nr:hypothetical protein DCCM_0171 [Desulfocucumis palustris]
MTDNIPHAPYPALSFETEAIYYSIPEAINRINIIEASGRSPATPY